MFLFHLLYTTWLALHHTNISKNLKIEAYKRLTITTACQIKLTNHLKAVAGL